MDRELVWDEASDVARRVGFLVGKLEIEWVKAKDVICFRSKNSKSRAMARIWGLPRVWQLALGVKPKYVLEVVSERFDKLSQKEQDGVLLHELAHIPKTFSGALMPHRKGKGGFYSKLRKMKKDYEKL